MIDRSDDAALASRFAEIALGHVTREYPNKLDHVLNGPDDLRAPRSLHPLFYGSFDWHSCVHSYWLLCTVRRRFPGIAPATRIDALLDAQLTPENVAAECAYLAQASSGTFERPYGWAWLLMLAAELSRHTTADGRRHGAALAPLAAAFAQRFMEFLPRATYPVRAGTHANSAFALALAAEYADVCADEPLARVVRENARAWFERDADCPAWEPGGEDFLSPALVEAECMRRVLAPDAFAAWLTQFLPRLVRGEPAALFEPAVVSDRTDGKIAHLDGLNLSRAWCMRAIARALSADDAGREPLLRAADAHVGTSLPYVASDYMGEHWLATFAVLAMLAG